MKKLLTGTCHADNIFSLVDPTAFLETEFEAEVVKALSCLFPEYWCGVFSGAFELEGDRRIADLALISKTFSHWFVVEVELAGHSFDDHVLPQLRCFRYGEPLATCITSLQRAFSFLDEDKARLLLEHIPRYVAVVANLPTPEWNRALRALDVHILTVSVYRDRNGRTAHEVDGALVPRVMNLGFARYSAIDNSLKIPKSCGLPLGSIQVIDQFGTPALWTVRESSGLLWLTKDRGPALLTHDGYVQILRTFDGRISIKPSN